MEHWNQDTIEHVEEFKVMLMNRSNAVLGIMDVSKGGISGTVTDVRILLQAAIKANASGIIVCHNHPSGNLNPSEADTRLTQKSVFLHDLWFFTLTNANLATFTLTLEYIQ